MKHKVPIIFLCATWQSVIIIPYSQYGHHKWKSYLMNKVSKISTVKMIQVIYAQKFTHKMHVIPWHIKMVHRDEMNTNKRDLTFEDLQNEN